MHWKLKARLQNAAAALPPALGNPVYYFAQRHFLGLRTTDPVSRLQAGLEIVRRIEQHKRTVAGATVLEVGTGHQLNLPVALWLSGAAEVTTVDINRYVKDQLVRSDVAYMRDHQQELQETFGPRASTETFQARFARLAQSRTLDQLLNAANIHYNAPADAAHLDLPDGSVDYHVSYTVLEHIHPATLSAILREGKRVLKPGGLLVHCIDFSDHFSHSDSSISSVNFLQFSDREWSRLGGNRFMYHNRLRVDEFRDLLEQAGLDVIGMEPFVDERAKNLLEHGGFPLDVRFRVKSPAINATSHAWVVGR